MRRSYFLVAALAVMTLGARRRDDGWHHVHGANGLTLSTKEPIDLSFAGVDGQTFRVADHRGKVVVINLFASWCGPCNAEAPDVSAFAAEHAADTIVVSVDVGEAADTARTFGKRYGAQYAFASDAGSQTARAIGMTAYPTTLFIRPDGRLSCAFVGQMSRDDLETERTYALT